MLTEDKLNKWRLLLIISCLVGIIAPTLIITAFALFDPSIIIVKISILQTYNINVRRWEVTYKKEFQKYQFYLYMNETIGSENSYSSESLLSSSLIEESLNKEDMFEGGSLVIEDSTADRYREDSNSNSNADSSAGQNKLNIQFKQSSIAEHVSYPTTEMIQLYTPIIFIANTSIFLKDKYKIDENNFEPYNVTLHLFVRKPSANHLTYLSKLSFTLFNKVVDGHKEHHHSTSNNNNNNNINNKTTTSTTTPISTNNLLNTPTTTTSKNHSFHAFQNACFVYKDTTILQEPCVYKTKHYNYTKIEDINSFYEFNSTYIRIKSYRDPYILAGDLTEGKYSFAMDKDTQSKLGLAFLIAGCFAFLLFLAIVWIVVKMKRYQTSLDKIDDLNTNSPLEMEEYNNNHIHYQNNIVNNNNNNNSNNNNNNSNNNNSNNNRLNNRNRHHHHHHNNNNNQDIDSDEFNNNNNNGNNGNNNSEEEINQDFPNFYNDDAQHIINQHQQQQYQHQHHHHHHHHHNNQSNFPPIHHSSINNENDSVGGLSPQDHLDHYQQQDIRHVSFDEDHDLISAEDEQRFQNLRMNSNNNNNNNSNSNSFNEFDNHSSISHSRSTNQPIIRNNNQSRYSSSNSSCDLKSSFSV